jgi:hypothetical protein
MKNLPIGLQELQSFRDNNCVYVDKTQLIHKLATSGIKYYFLSRPRRFGKSLLISTFKELFSGNRELFTDLWIEPNWDWSKKHPIIHLPFDKLSFDSLGLGEAIKTEFSKIAANYDITLVETDYREQFKEILEKLYKKHGKVVLLIDEYDKPINDYLEFAHIEKAKTNQAVMRQFYSVLKSAEPYLRFVFITGVSKFSKVSIFSAFNNLVDITIDDNYATITGYTQKELTSYFDDYIQLVQDKLKISRGDLLKQIKDWYNGYSWDGETTLYNPFGILNFLSKKRFHNFWFSTGSPTFLINQMKHLALYQVENHTINSIQLDDYDIENLSLIPLLFQAGYLTVKHIDPMYGDMVLDYPNREVRESMYQFCINDLVKNPHRTNTGMTIVDLNKAFLSNDLLKVKTIVNSLVSTLPYEAYKNQSEGFYHGLLHLIFSYLGIFIESEVHLSNGRADVVVHTPTHIYVLEFKFNLTAKEGVEQIQKQGYADKYRAAQKNIVGIGINFSEAERKIDDWIEVVL